MSKGFAPQIIELDANRQPLLEHIAEIELTTPQYLSE